MFDNEPFFKILKKDVLAFGVGEATILAFVSEFEARNMKCWVSRKYIAERVGMSEATVQRKIDRLLEIGALMKTTIDGRRCLETSLKRWDGCSFYQEQSVVLAEA